MNQIFLIGRISKEPELKYSPKGTAVCSVSVAVDRIGEKKEVDFIPVVIWGKMAENTAQYVDKGNQIAIRGRLQIRSYEAKDGSKKYVTEVVAEEVQFIEWAKKEEKMKEVKDIDESDIPF